MHAYCTQQCACVHIRLDFCLFDWLVLLSDGAIAVEYDQCGGKLSKSVSGTMSDVFAKVLRGLSGAKLTRPGTFRSAAGDAAVRCSYKADDG